MTEQSAQAKLVGTRIDGPIDNGAINEGAINDVAINGITPATKAIQAFAREVAQMSRQALDRTTEHIEKLPKAHRMEEAAAIHRDFVKDSVEHAEQHTRKVCELLAAFRPETAQTYPDDWLQSVTAEVQTTEAKRHAAA